MFECGDLHNLFKNCPLCAVQGNLKPVKSSTRKNCGKFSVLETWSYHFLLDQQNYNEILSTSEF